eukprot:GHVL01011851.1.p1 GENE.GHVL01011851.1~~GHVL01011851.1.p1  ORF type:complete len:250 (-),score=15.14 GHVL01011851.1:232-981(-)
MFMIVKKLLCSCIQGPVCSNIKHTSKFRLYFSGRLILPPNYKLEAIGMRGRLLCWIRSYLNDRSQSVVVKGHMSASQTVPAGVPQGSVLGPLLFLIYINDIVLNVQSTVKSFADDTSMYLSMNDSQLRNDILNSDLQELSRWANDWKVKFNNEKIELLNFKRHDIDFDCLTFNDIDVQDTAHHKHLGVVLQNDCKWNVHINSIASKVMLLINCLKFYKHRFSRKSLEIMYKSYVLPHFDWFKHNFIQNT